MRSHAAPFATGREQADPVDARKAKALDGVRAAVGGFFERQRRARGSAPPSWSAHLDAQDAADARHRGRGQ